VKFVDLGGFAGWMQACLREASAEQGNPALEKQAFCEIY